MNVPTWTLARRSPHTSCGCLRLLPTVTREAPAASLPVEPPEKTTSSAQYLRAYHDRWSAIGPVRVVARSVEDEKPAVLHDFDPFTFNND